MPLCHRNPSYSLWQVAAQYLALFFAIYENCAIFHLIVFSYELVMFSCEMWKYDLNITWSTGDGRQVVPSTYRYYFLSWIFQQSEKAPAGSVPDAVSRKRPAEPALDAPPMKRPAIPNPPKMGKILLNNMNNVSGITSCLQTLHYSPRCSVSRITMHKRELLVHVYIYNYQVKSYRPQTCKIFQPNIGSSVAEVVTSNSLPLAVVGSSSIWGVKLFHVRSPAACGRFVLLPGCL